MIREVAEQDRKRAIDLVNDMSSEFVAVGYSEQGRNTFESYLKTKLQEVTADVNAGHKKMWAYYQGDEILGVIAVQNASHISLLFVAKSHHKKGIAKRLLHFALEEITKDAAITQITVNSSPYAVEAYGHLGFVKTTEQQEKDGIRFIPMMRPV